METKAEDVVITRFFPADGSQQKELTPLEVKELLSTGYRLVDIITSPVERGCFVTFVLAKEDGKTSPYLIMKCSGKAQC